MATSIQPQTFDYFLVLDFEATCEENRKLTPQEVIEFPVLKVGAKTFEIQSTFHQYVQPKVYRQLTPFCIQLTGITQDKVDGQPDLETTLKLFDSWMVEQRLIQDDIKFAFVTCGDWDLKKMLPQQSSYFGFEYPDYLKRWINIKKTFKSVTGVYPQGDLLEMLERLGLKLEGRHHSGIDDCRNIARVLECLAEKGCVFEINGRL